jgi:hypothetical protein
MGNHAAAMARNRAQMASVRLIATSAIKDMPVK